MVCQNRRKAIVSLTTFALILMVLISLFTVSYFYSENSKSKVLAQYKKEELLNAELLFRSEMLNLVTKVNSTSNYKDVFVGTDVRFSVSSNSISGVGRVNNILVNYDISTLGIVFCSSYEFVPAESTLFFFDGYCIGKEE